MSSKQFYFLSQLNVNELNFLLQSVSDRLDAIEGQRGNPEIFAALSMKDNNIQSVAAPINSDDAAILKTLEDQIAAALIAGNDVIFDSIVGTDLTITDIVADGAIEVKDATDTIIHSFGES